PIAFVTYLRNHRFAPYPFKGVVQSILAAHVAQPASLGAAPDDFASRPDFWLERWKAMHPGEMLPAFDPVAPADEVWMRVAKPALDAGKLFDDFLWLTRLFTTL